VNDDGDDGDADPEYDVDFREHPEAYGIGRGEQGAFKIPPYKHELLPLWGIADLDAAEEGAAAIHEQYREYRDRGESPGMTMARKYLRMGRTRARRYAKYLGGKKYETNEDGERVERDLQRWYDGEKREIALVYEERSRPGARGRGLPAAARGARGAVRGIAGIDRRLRRDVTRQENTHRSGTRTDLESPSALSPTQARFPGRWSSVRSTARRLPSDSSPTHPTRGT